MPEINGINYTVSANTNRHPWTEATGWLTETWRTANHEESEYLAKYAVERGWSIWIVANVDPPGLVVYKQLPPPEFFTGISIALENGYEIVSGWIDDDDPDALEAGDYLQVLNDDGEEIYYQEAADILADPIEGKRALLNFLLACQGRRPVAADPAKGKPAID